MSSMLLMGLKRPKLDKNESEPWLGRNGFVYNLQAPHLSEKEPYPLSADKLNSDKPEASGSQ